MSVTPDGPAAGPIADVSYRPYDGPLHTSLFRWWIVARAMVRLSLKKKGFWVLACLALLPYLFPGFQLYLRSRAPAEFAVFLAQRPFTSFFYDAYAQSQLWIFLLTLLVGAASIAGDNRTNALQIYLSKPLTKRDYLMGKWASIFVILAVVSFLPALALYLFCLGSFSDQGFLRDHPHLWLQVLATSLLPAVLNASLILGFSAWFKRPLLAGGSYAAFYFGLQIVAGLIAAIMWRTGHAARAGTIAALSLPGLLRGLGQHIYDATPTFFGMPMRGRGGMEPVRPELLPLILLAVALVLVGLAAARARVRAVEVVRG
jgi:ABC-2 type transport system permease protein